MKDQSGAAEIEFALPCQDCGCHAVFMGPSRRWEMFEFAIPALLPVRQGAEGLRDAAWSIERKPDTAFGDGGADRGVKEPARLSGSLCFRLLMLVSN